MNLVLKTVSCLIIVASLFYYNQMMKLNVELAEANVKMEEMAVTIEQALAPKAAPASGSDAVPPAEPESKYKDGVYSGTAQGYGGPVTTELTLAGGKIVGIEITSSEGEDAAYYNMCLGILDEIAARQSADVDAVSGATLTSNGIIGGVKEALDKAVKG